MKSVVVFMMVLGSTYGFAILLRDVIIGGLNLSVWIHRKIVERDQ